MRRTGSSGPDAYEAEPYVPAGADLRGDPWRGMTRHARPLVEAGQRLDVLRTEQHR